MRNVLLPLILLLMSTVCPASYLKLANAQDGQPKVTQGDIEQILASNQPASTPQAQKSGPGGMNFLQLLIDGGMLMIPIGFMSLLVLAIGFERWVALRSSKVFPRRLKREIRRAIDNEAPLTPVELYRAAELVPSSAAKVLVDMLSKVGRPIAEVESEITESVQREADRLYGNVRWLTLAAAVTPLIGLLGTVWGLILAFFNTTQLT
ncbi:MAG: MotA/TolQ/ExbB proton channel family protein, partial [Pirellulales bacterium]